MSGDQLTVRSPGDRVITEYLCDHALIADCATQLQQTGEETQELHQFVTAIVAGDVEVQEGISIDALRDMALTVGDGLGALGDYFVKLGTVAWNYADACRVAGERTGHMFERRGNLEASLAALVLEREQSEGCLTDARSLPEDGTASGCLILYSALDSEGSLDAAPHARVLDGMPKETAVPAIESHLEVLKTLQDNVHSRNDEMLLQFDAAVEEWEGEAEAFVRSLEGILGVLADTRAEDNYQRVGDLSEAASWAGVGFDVIVLIPGGQAIGVAGGKVVEVVEVGADVGQLVMLGSGSREGTIRTAEGQLFDEGLELAEGHSGPPIGHMLGKSKLRDAWKELLTAVTGVSKKTIGVVADGIDPGRTPDLPEDIAIDSSPIASWQPEADASNPETAYAPGSSMPTSEERARSVPGAAVQIPVADGSSDGPTRLPSAQPEPAMTVTAPSSSTGEEQQAGAAVRTGPESGSSEPGTIPAVRTAPGSTTSEPGPMHVEVDD